MVLPGDELSVKICHIGMHDGNMAVEIETFNDCAVWEGTDTQLLVVYGFSMVEIVEDDPTVYLCWMGKESVGRRNENGIWFVLFPFLPSLQTN